MMNEIRDRYERDVGGRWPRGAQREDDGLAVDYLMMAPAAGTEHIDWMRATRALDVAIATTDLRGAEAEVA